jgi:hypothetical protein
MLDFSGIDSNTKFVGTFPVVVKTIGTKTSQAGNPCVSVEFSVTGDSFNGRRQFENFTMSVEYAQKRFAQLLDALDVPRKLDSYSQLHNKTCRIVTVEKKGEEYPVISEFLPMEKVSSDSDI